MEEQLIQLIDEENFVDFKKLFKNFKKSIQKWNEN